MPTANVPPHARPTSDAAAFALGYADGARRSILGLLRDMPPALAAHVLGEVAAALGYTLLRADAEVRPVPSTTAAPARRARRGA